MPADPPYRDDQPTRRIPRTPPGGRPGVPRRLEAPVPPLEETRVMPRAAGTPRLDGPRPQGRGGHPPQPPAHGPAPQRPARPVATTVRRRRRPRPGRLLLLLAVLLVAYPVALGATAWAKVTEVSALPAASPADTPGTTFLVVGSDSRAGLDEAQRQELSTGNDEGHRTDTIMLLHVPDSGGPTALISIPRDSYVPIPGHGRNKINSSFSIGGPQLLVQTVEEVSGLRVDHYVETGFGGFARIVDAVGGVDMCVPSPVRDERAGLDLAAGCQTMDGPTALGFARYRYSDPLGDLGRVQRQRELLAAIMAKGASPATLANPLRAVPLASAGGSALVLDERATPWTLLTFARGMRAAASTAGISMTVPIGDPALRTPAGTAVKWDTERAVAMFEALKADDTEQLRALAG